MPSLSMNEMEIFERIARQILFIINPLKKDIPLTQHSARSRIEIGAESRFNLATNLNEEERDLFTTAIFYLSSHCCPRGLSAHTGDATRPIPNTDQTHTRLHYLVKGIIPFVLAFAEQNERNVARWLRDFEACIAYTKYLNEGVEFFKEFNITFEVAVDDPSGELQIVFYHAAIPEITAWFRRVYSEDIITIHGTNEEGIFWKDITKHMTHWNEEKLEPQRDCYSFFKRIATFLPIAAILNVEKPIQTENIPSLY